MFSPARSLKYVRFPALLAVFVVCAAFAQEPKVRVSIGENEEIWVGQRITLVVELLAPGYFDSAPSFDLPDPPGLMIIPPAGSPLVSSEDADGTSYTVQRHELSVFSSRGGKQTIPPLGIRFRYKHQPLDKESVTASVRTPPLEFTVKLPPGAEKLGGVISARNLTAVESWKPEPGKAKAGDAFTRTITYSAPEVPAMAFPPFPTGAIDGLGIYPKPPVVLDHNDRGDFQGERRDTITYVCKRPGTIVIPPVKLTWYDLDAKELKTITFPQRTLEIAPNPALASASSAQSKTKPTPSHLALWLWFAGITSALAVGFWIAPSHRFHQTLLRLVHPLLPVHLQPLNPNPTKPTP